MRLLILATKPPSRLAELKWILEFAAEVERSGGDVAVYLASDAVLAARRQACRLIEELASVGCKLYACRESLEAYGIGHSLLKEVRVLEDFYSQLVEDIMERSTHVISV